MVALSELDILKENVMAIVSDNGPYMVRGARLLREQWDPESNLRPPRYGCLSHGLSLVSEAFRIHLWI